METAKKKRIGIASIFDPSEIKEYFNTFFILLFGIEFVIFVAHFIGSIGPQGIPFPWKQYFFVSFIAPVVMIFIIGLIVIGFNFYLFGNDEAPMEAPKDEQERAPGKKRMGRSFQDFFTIIQQLPALGGIFLLGLGSVILYKLDIILATIGHVGEKTAHYLFILFAAFVAGTLIFLLFWIFWKFKLHKYQMEEEWKYKNRVMEKTGLIILKDNTVINEDGRLIAGENANRYIEGHIIEEEPDSATFTEKILLK